MVTFGKTWPLVSAMLTMVWYVTSEKIGVIGEFSYTRVTWQTLQTGGSAMNIGLEQLVADGVLSADRQMSIVYKDTYLQSDGVGNVVDLVTNEDVYVIFGSISSRVVIPAAHLTAHWNFPHITFGANSFELADKSLFRTLVRSIGPLSELGKAMVPMMKMFNWYRIAMLYYDYGLCKYSADGIKSALEGTNITIIQSVTYPLQSALTDTIIGGYLRLLKQVSRVIYICDSANLRRIMLQACANGMCGGDFVFITGSLDAPSTRLWAKDDDDDEAARVAFKHLLYIDTAESVGEEGSKRLVTFEEDVIRKMADPPWNSTYAALQNRSAAHYSQYLYDATYLYGLWLNYSSTHNISVRNGAAMLDFSKNLSFNGLSGPCDMGDTGDRIPYFWIHRFSEDGSPTRIATAMTKLQTIEEHVTAGGFRWYTADGKVPPDTPTCGFFNEHCLVEEKDQIAVILSVGISLAVAFLALGAIAYIIRKRQIEAAMIASIWKIEINDIELQKSKVGMGSRMSMSVMSRESRMASSHVSNDTISRQNIPLTMTKVALFHGQTVSVRKVNKSATSITREDMMDLKTMREMQHDNINTFIGACFDCASPCVLFLYCAKGSLQDILENDDIQLDVLFRYSLMMDLVQGMIYIHSSKLVCHGRLKTSNCLVDSRWVLKITDFGVTKYIKGSSSNNANLEEHELYKSLLWTAPELLQDTPSSLKDTARGTKSGDVYSFGIIMHEIFYRMGTFAGNAHMTAKDIIARVRSRESNPCRPEVYTDNPDVIAAIVKLMQLCWADDASMRPSFNIVKSYVKTNIPDINTNIVDVMLQRLEKYASNLEDLVDQRTQQLMAEKQKTDRLLYRMLPPSCADKLKIGESVAPEIYDSATVYFSDVVGFTTIAAISSPMEVIDLLNDLYTCFDDIIAKYDAYKVETIGDAYLVVSGIPKRNGDLHAGIIADMAMDIMDQTYLFKIKHMPDRCIRLRIGMHTGSCCAGVVGLSMPRYCLFGDTVNTASRMESNGESQKIHVSETSALALQGLGGYMTSLRGEVPIKGKGIMTTYWLEGRKGRTMNAF